MDNSIKISNPLTTGRSGEKINTPSLTSNFSDSANFANTPMPGTLKVIKRNGTLVPYDESKIKIAITKAFLAIEGGTAAASSRIHGLVNQLAQQISAIFKRRMPTGGAIHIEDIQDQVELALMRGEEHKIARAYVLYREERRKNRIENQKINDINASQIIITNLQGIREPLEENYLQTIVKEACSGLEAVDSHTIVEDTKRNLFEGASWDDVNKALIMSARALIESEPNHTYVAARLLLHDLHQEALEFLHIPSHLTFSQMNENYSNYFKTFIHKGIELDILNEELGDFDLERLARALKPERDFQFTYLGLQTLYDRYFLHSEGTRYELPQAFFMRVAMGLALKEADRNARAIEFYELLSTFRYMSSTPTLFNSGTTRPQLSSCFLTTVPDDLEGIYNAIRDNALLSKFAGGLGNDWTSVRAMGAHIKGTNGKSLGVVPFMNVADATAIAVNQGGKRKGAVCGYLESWHLDIEEFLELRKNTGDDRRRTHDMNTANWIPDLFMQRVFEDQEWSLFSPDDVPLLHDSYGADFAKHYENYEELAHAGKIKNFKKISAKKLWRKMLGMLFETGHPWITFKDACNLRSPQQHVGVIHSSNLCTEITLNTSAKEIAVCNLGSINLPVHIQNGKIDATLLQDTVRTAVRMLDNVIDINYYAVPQASYSNMRHRPVGLGIMGFQDALYKLSMDYSSNEAIEFADRSMELISYYALSASADLSEERGAYSTFEGSLWSQGVLPIDSIEILQQRRGQYLELDRSQTLDWASLRNRIKTRGIRNSNVLAIAPTATISNICGVSQSIEPTYQNLYVKSNLSGEFTVTNPYLVNELKALGLWDNVMVNDLKYYNGSIQAIDRIPEYLKNRYATAFEIEAKWLVEAAARRQKWIDQSQSLNIYMAEPSGKKLDRLYRIAWLRGLKTTYYLRSLGASNAEKSTISDGALNAVKVQKSIEQTPQACLIDDPDCEACQ